MVIGIVNNGSVMVLVIGIVTNCTVMVMVMSPKYEMIFKLKISTLHQFHIVCTAHHHHHRHHHHQYHHLSQSTSKLVWASSLPEYLEPWISTQLIFLFRHSYGDADHDNHDVDLLVMQCRLYWLWWWSRSSFYGYKKWCCLSLNDDDDDWTLSFKFSGDDDDDDVQVMRYKIGGGIQPHLDTRVMQNNWCLSSVDNQNLNPNHH